jgi:hypothetical protein
MLEVSQFFGVGGAAKADLRSGSGICRLSGTLQAFVMAANLSLTALTGLSTPSLSAAVRPVKPAIRCNREIRTLVNSQIADKGCFRCGCAKGWFGDCCILRLRVVIL